jgi:hypothetical protein
LHLYLDENDTMVNFDIVFLFIKIHVPKSLEFISKVIDLEIINLIEICLISTFCTFKGICYEKTKGIAMGSSLSLVVAKFFMEHFKDLV